MNAGKPAGGELVDGGAAARPLGRVVQVVACRITPHARPDGAVFEKDGKRVVYRRAGDGFLPVEIAIGRQSISRVVLDSGLAAGDVIALHDPTEKRALGPAGSAAGEASRSRW